MNFSQTLIAKLSSKHLLKHEFYQMWSCGSVPLETLQLYARQYYHHVNAFPRYLSATHSNCESLATRQFLLQNLREEEEGTENHPELWLRFAEGLGTCRATVKSETPLRETQELTDTFMKSSKNSFLEGLGVLFSYEHQIPEVASFKIDALKKHYAIESQETLSFFEVHRQADVFHTQTLSAIMDDLAPENQKIVEQAATVGADQLWKFLDGIYKTFSV